MTADRDFDRIARAWLDLMPDEAPDRTVAAVLQAVEATPQARRRPWPAAWRFPRMNRLSLIVLIGILIGLLGIGGLVAGGFNSPSDVQPVPTASAATDAILIPPSLDHTWIIAPRTAAEDAVGYGATLTFSDADGGSADLAPISGFIRSAATLERPGVLRLSSTRTSGGCRQGDVGTYRFTLSPGGRHLGLAAEADRCAARLAAIAGDWVETACKVGFNPTPALSTDCYGDLDAGTYPTRALRLRGPDAAHWGNVTFTVPDGWADAADEHDRFYLLPSADYANPDTVNNWTGLFLFGHPVAASTAPDCPTSAEAGVGHTAQQLIDWIRARPGVHATTPEPITINGHSGLWIDVTLDSRTTATCPWSGGAPFVPLIETNDSVIGAVDLRQRYFVVDIGGGDSVLILVNTPDAARFDAFVSQAMPVIQSLQFR